MYIALDREIDTYIYKFVYLFMYLYRNRAEEAEIQNLWRGAVASPR